MAFSAPCVRLFKFKNYINRKCTKYICGYLQKCSINSINFNQGEYNSMQTELDLHVKPCNESNPIQTASEDLSPITPYFSNTFNLAAYVNKSDTLKNLVDLNVNLSKIERKPYIVEKLLKLDFDKDMKNHIIFISDFIGMDALGSFITKNPLIFCEPLQDLEVRINYLNSKGFKDDQIKRIILNNPFWLMFSTLRIDRRFGFFQKSLVLNGDEVRYLASKQSKLITYNLHHVRTNIFVIKEEMGFEENEIRNVVLHKPRLLMLNQNKLLQRFNYIHNVMKISHQSILDEPEILMCRNFRVKQRHLFLEKLGRAQYDPKKENYVPLKSLVENTDAEFCTIVAKCNVDDFNMFLKTQ